MKKKETELIDHYTDLKIQLQKYGSENQNNTNRDRNNLKRAHKVPNQYVIQTKANSKVRNVRE